ncbi:AAA family ATPase [Acetobacter thailandicus]|uniref:AAA family ATPase n=1 Tax=Acetobacter thailandicus TaxID=1502842 RepID=UPI001BAE1590|nr:AAA family ATPase [Acetobacter thailandicus]MBS0984886.1 AAA family ATPase [Acetobacter thailandicus]
MSFTFPVPSICHNPVTIELNPGSSTFFVGANGSGKTRLAALAEKSFGHQAHRIAAHRSLRLDPSVAKISEQKARKGLRFGYADLESGQESIFRYNNRWGKKAETYLLNDFDFLLQTLFAEQSNVALRTHNAAHAGDIGTLELTRFQKLSAIWDRILPHRILKITGDDINTSVDGQPPYSAADMSDGERAVFYMLGQVLVAEPDSLLIFDEPELHVHRAILSRLWDEIELARPDCAFLVITHDLEFVASRAGQKFSICRYLGPNQWEIEKVPENTGFSEEVATLILGSRKPILFVEGTGSSLDLAIYRACYPEWTVLPRGACENVIHAVATMRRNACLTRIECSGIVDADDYSDEDKQRLSSLGVAVLPVSEIENLFLLPDIAAAILEEEKFHGEELQIKLDSLNQEVFTEVNRPGAIEETVLRYCRRRIDRTLKKIDLKDAASSTDLALFYTERTTALNVGVIANEYRERIEEAIRKCDLPVLLAHFDNKGLLSLAAKHLRNTSKGAFESWLARAMRDPNANKLKAALGQILPQIIAQ